MSKLRINIIITYIGSVFKAGALSQCFIPDSWANFLLIYFIINLLIYFMKKEEWIEN